MDIDLYRHQINSQLGQEARLMDNSASSFRSTVGKKPALIGTTIFYKDNQSPRNESLATDFLIFPIPPKKKLIELEEEYIGFDLTEWGEIKVSYNKEGYSFLYNFKYICLDRQTHNDYYPDQYLIVCFELELEGSGNTKEAALKDLQQLLDIYFIHTKEICNSQEEYTSAISANITQEKPWKQSFAIAYKQAQKLGVLNADYSHKIT